MKELILDLAKKYAAIAIEANCKTGNELSKKTYELREQGVDIPYLAVVTTNQTWTPNPKKSQRVWRWWLDHNDAHHKAMHEAEGWYNIYVDTVEGGFRIQAYNAKFITTTDNEGNKKTTAPKTVIAEYTFKFDFIYEKANS